MIDDPDLLQNAVVRRMLIVSDRLRRETGYDLEQVFQAY